MIINLLLVFHRNNHRPKRTGKKNGSPFLLLRGIGILIFRQVLRTLEIVSLFYFLSSRFFIACYFASLMQVLYHLPNIQQKILEFNTNSKYNKIDVERMKEMDSIEKIKVRTSRELVKNM